MLVQHTIVFLGSVSQLWSNINTTILSIIIITFIFIANLTVLKIAVIIQRDGVFVLVI